MRPDVAFGIAAPLRKALGGRIELLPAKGLRGQNLFHPAAIRSDVRFGRWVFDVLIGDSVSRSLGVHSGSVVIRFFFENFALPFSEKGYR